MKPITRKFLKESYPYIKVNNKNNDIIINNIDTQETMKVPSNLYPLRNKKSLKVFTSVDTKELEQNTGLSKIYNEQRFQLGFCYQNIESLVTALKKGNYKNVRSYVGWVLTGQILKHHCWLVFDDIHILDPGVSKLNDIVYRRMIEENADIERGREIFTEIYTENKNTPNSEFYTFGQVSPFNIYIGTETKPSLGLQVFKELMEEYPNHPSYPKEGKSPNGGTKLQEMINKNR